MRLAILILLIPLLSFGQSNRDRLLKKKAIRTGRIVPSSNGGITFFGVSTNPSDNGTSSATTISVTPPGSMQAGDLVVVFLVQRGTATITQNATGGQTWTALAAAYTVPNTGNTLRLRAFWCEYDGTWTADPSWDFTAGNATQAQMLVFRPSSPSITWAVDTGIANASMTASPYTITGYTPANNNNVTIAQFSTNSAVTWGGLSGTNWTKSGLADQYRVENAGATDLSTSYAYQIQGIKQATNDVSQTQTGGPVNSGSSIVTFYEN
jgi:hypothetical protein